MSFSGVTTGGDLTFVGGDYTSGGTQMPLIDLEIAMRESGPLTRLFHDNEAESDWLRARKEHLESTLTPPNKSRGDGGLGLVRMYMDTRNHAEDLKTFNERLTEYLKACRSILLDNVLARLDGVENNENRIVFTVRNPTDTPIRGVRLEASFIPASAIAFLYGPSAKPWPSLPKWPDFSDDFVGWRGLLDDASMRMLAEAVPFLPSRGAQMTRDGDRVRVSFEVGDLRPEQVRPLQPFTILPGLDDGDELHLAVRANAMDRRGVVDMGFVVRIGQSGWPLDSIVPPDF